MIISRRQIRIKSPYERPAAVAARRAECAAAPHRARRPVIGLGDAVEVLARPIAARLDRWFGTKLTGCSACSKRRKWLNWLVPDVRSWRTWAGIPGRLRGSKRGRKDQLNAR